MVFMPHWPVPLWHKKKYDLESMGRILELMRIEYNALPPVIHVAGTNGKGSSVAYLSAIFKHAGYRVHAYTSPHLLECNERIVLNSEKITNAYLFDICERARLVSEKHGIKLSFFEGLTAAAFLAFAETKGDILILETGMGGRLDATNIIPNPILTVITEISYDHMEYLGPKIDIIASEKAGIIKSSAPCAISSQVDEVYEVLFNKCDEVGVESIAYGYDFGIKKLENGFNILGTGCDDFVFNFPSLLGDHQIMNAATVIAGLRKVAPNISLDQLNYGISNTVWPGRIQKVRAKNCEIWADGAHNSGGALALSNWIESALSTKAVLILGMTKNRNVRDFLRPLLPFVEEVMCVQVTSEPSSYTPEKLASLVISTGLPAKECQSLEEAIEVASRYELPIVLTGSLFLVADLLKIQLIQQL